ncbi:small subunit ribosomal protein S16 [Marchantia polymorpha subsp. ruderalis]|uniref:30S ribosomal protein S16, chloroplastic n=2 Tax=Marchantia polymorpha TaxID=3197 RepID=A0AAF6B6P0_MARPO|nr:hypothetical protein MARPO_0087s0037 [Marchantia polymorpha]BBN07674.1 hypothetical protein Mp_4g05530 [Marchantia polymorpha subsp. ruderalis]|eukprot:PTQ33598.1 hypothetical protein MARPO_0087s0037 [Marchantia polymorpha]
MGLVRLRLARFGRRNLPFYRITAADSRAPRDGKHLEVVGHYNPMPGKDGLKRIGINTERIKYWLSVGAQPSDPVARLLHLVGLMPKPPASFVVRKGLPPKKQPTAAAAE